MSLVMYYYIWFPDLVLIFEIILKTAGRRTIVLRALTNIVTVIIQPIVISGVRIEKSIAIKPVPTVMAL